MISLPGYKLIEEIFQSSSKRAFKAIRTIDAMPVIVKMPVSASVEDFPVQELEREFDLLASCPLSGLLKGVRKCRLEDNLILELENFEGLNLQRFLEAYNLSYTQRLILAVNLVSVVEELHLNRILHRDIRPLNFLVHPQTLEIKCIDLSYATSLDTPGEKTDLKEKFLYALEYLSPEQTGRISLEEDCRSDLYCLGITLYKVFTGRVPFEGGDLNEVIHAHLAKQPPAPIQLDHQIPLPLSELVLRLIEKKPEERYQCARGVKADLKECLAHYKISRQIPSFPLGRFDQLENFEILPVLYGRDEQMEVLIHRYEGAKNSNQTVLIYGNSGTGKSSLVEEFHKRLQGGKSIFVFGKFNQYHQNIPFEGITKAFREHILTITRLPEDQKKEWKEQILKAVGNLGQVIIDEIPELESIIGQQPQVADVPSHDASHRNILVFSKFIDVFAQPAHPLVIFLDDLQWADSGSLQFLQHMAAGESSHILLIGTYRDNEISSGHPLFKTIAEIKKNSTKLTQIGLHPLTFRQTEDLLTDTLACPVNEIRPLADVVFTRTLGNPLFIHTFLTSLYQDRLLYYDSSEKRWAWHLSQVREYTHSTSSVELITGKIQRLSANAQQALSYGACIGGQFELEILASLVDKPAHEAAEDLKEAITQSLIAPSANRLNTNPQGFSAKKCYVFQHDQIQQAAYALVPDELKKELHLSIGYRLLNIYSEAELDQYIFEIVSHLNYGSSLIVEEKDIVKIVELNLLAGKKAKASTAFEVALNYFTTGLEYLSGNSLQKEVEPTPQNKNKLKSGDKKWDVYDQLTLSLHLLAAETAYLTGQFDKSASLLQTSLPNVQTLQQKTDIHLLQIQSLIYQKKNEEAIELALQLLKKLGIRFPSTHSAFHVLTALVQCKWILKGKTTKDLENLPQLNNQPVGEAFRIIQSITAATHNTLPQLYPLLVLKMLFLSVKCGNAPQSPLAYATYGAMVNAIQTNNAACFRYGQLALHLLKQQENASIRAKTFLIYQLINRPSSEHIHHSLEPLKQSFISGIESGEIEYAVYASNSYCVFLLLSGKNLNWVKEEMISLNTLPKTIKGEIHSTGNEALIQIVSNFLGENPEPASLHGKYFKEEEGFYEIIKTNQKSKIFICYLYKSIFCYLLGDYRAGLENANSASNFLNEVKGMVLEPLYYFYQSLLHFAMYGLHPKKIFLSKALRYKNKVKKWAIQVPINHLHRFYLLEAEYFKVCNRQNQAASCYDKAIKKAKENNHCHEEALANELAGKFWLGRGQDHEASIYIHSSLKLYKKWGCSIKVNCIHEQYGSLLSFHTGVSKTTGYANQKVNSGNIASTFDLSTLMKAATAISSEVVFDKLLEKLMKVVIENAGAQLGYFILERSGKLVIEAKQSVEEEKVWLMKIPLTQSESLPQGIIGHVFTTKENIIINNAGQENQFKEELLQLDHTVKSILCIPTLNQGKLIGVLYLENNLTSGAFTQDRVEILKLLAGQIAVSIENAILYENLEQKVLERTTKIQIQKEEIERQKQLVEEKSRFKEQFFANMSHEIRTPMTAIIGMSELIFDTPLTPKQLEYAKGIKYSSENLLAIINDILDYSKIEAGKFSFVKKPFQLQDRINRLSYILQSLAQEKGIEIKIAIDSRISPQLIGDPLRLHQILLNLASNAIKFTQKGHVELIVEKISENEKTEALCFKVKDTGIGIPEEKLHFIFETFTRIEDEVNIQPSGTGLGLFIAKKLVEEQGGIMKVKSQLSQGTEFQFTLPFEKSAGAAFADKKVYEQQVLCGIKVLLVEDTLFNQVVAEEILKKIIPEVEVSIAENGLVALQKLEVQDFDIVLMDVKMPVMDGYKAARIIRETDKLKKIPILAFTANANPIEAEKCKQAGMDDYISKPIESGKLKEKINKLLERR